MPAYHQCGDYNGTSPSFAGTIDLAKWEGAPTALEMVAAPGGAKWLAVAAPHLLLYRIAAAGALRPAPAPAMGSAWHILRIAATGPHVLIASQANNHTLRVQAFDAATWAPLQDDVVPIFAAVTHLAFAPHGDAFCFTTGTECWVEGLYCRAPPGGHLVWQALPPLDCVSSLFYAGDVPFVAGSRSAAPLLLRVTPGAMAINLHSVPLQPPRGGPYTSVRAAAAHAGALYAVLEAPRCPELWVDSNNLGCLTGNGFGILSDFLSLRTECASRGGEIWAPYVEADLWRFRPQSPGRWLAAFQFEGRWYWDTGDPVTLPVQNGGADGPDARRLCLVLTPDLLLEAVDCGGSYHAVCYRPHLHDHIKYVLTQVCPRGRWRGGGRGALSVYFLWQGAYGLVGH